MYLSLRIRPDVSYAVAMVWLVFVITHGPRMYFFWISNHDNVQLFAKWLTVATFLERKKNK